MRRLQQHDGDATAGCRFLDTLYQVQGHVQGLAVGYWRNPSLKRRVHKRQQGGRSKKKRKCEGAVRRKRLSQRHIRRHLCLHLVLVTFFGRHFDSTSSSTRRGASTLAHPLQLALVRDLSLLSFFEFQSFQMSNHGSVGHLSSLIPQVSVPTQSENAHTCETWDWPSLASLWRRRSSPRPTCIPGRGCTGPECRVRRRR